MLQIKLIYLWNMTLPEYSLFKLNVMLTCRRYKKKSKTPKENPPVISLCSPNRFSDRHWAGSVCSYIKTTEVISWLSVLWNAILQRASLRSFDLAKPYTWLILRGKKKKIKSTSSNEYGSMPRILSAALNGLGLDTMQGGTMSIIVYNGLYTKNCIPGYVFFFSHSGLAIPNWPNSLVVVF